MAIPAGAGIAGIAGMFIAVPAIGVVAATWRKVLSVLAVRREAVEASIVGSLQAAAEPSDSAIPIGATAIEPSTA
jgi:deoxyinosine 3'endonuclease (endonuclease V)